MEIKELKVMVNDHIENLETLFEKDEFTTSDIIVYCEILEEVYDDEFEDNLIEVIPATRKEFQKGILATVRYYNL